MSDLNNIISPEKYAETAVLAREVGEELMSRLDWMTIKPAVIVDMGSGTGELSLLLRKRYPSASVFALDSSLSMVQYSEQHLRDGAALCADAEKLPFSDQSVDLIFANFLLPWHADLNGLLREWKRVLRPDGLVMITALGPDTMKECGEAVLPTLVDMHDIGDSLLHEGFSDPVLDVCDYTLVYRDQDKLIAELLGSGMLSQPLTSGDLPLNEEGTWSLTFEVIFAHAFKPAETETLSASVDGMVRIPLAHLRRQLRPPKS